MRKLLKDFNISDGPLNLKADNQGTKSIAHEWKVNAAMKNIAVAYYLQRDYVEQGLVTISYGPSSEMLADAITKALTKEKLKAACGMMGLVTLNITPVGSEKACWTEQSQTYLSARHDCNLIQIEESDWMFY